MGDMVEFASNGATASGYLAKPASGSGPGLVVIQEWWGLNRHIREVTDRFATRGFVALAPDLYHGTVVAEPDEAGKEMMALDLGRAARDLSGAVDLLQALSKRDKIGVTGFCMGGGLTLTLACQRPDAIGVAVPWYGVIPWPEAQPDWSALEGSIVAHIAEKDEFFGPQAAGQLDAELQELGKDATFHVYEGAEHAFFNDNRPEVYNAEHAQTAWDRTLDALDALN